VLKLVSLSFHLTRDESRNEIERRYYLYPAALILNSPGTFATAIWVPRTSNACISTVNQVYTVFTKQYWIMWYRENS
jgi:hypothetical protein